MLFYLLRLIGLLLDLPLLEADCLLSLDLEWDFYVSYFEGVCCRLELALSENLSYLL